MSFSERSVQHGPDKPGAQSSRLIRCLLAAIVFALGLSERIAAQDSEGVQPLRSSSMSLQDRLRLLKAKKRNGSTTPPTTGANPYTNYRSQIPSTSDWNQSRRDDPVTNPTGFQPTRQNTPAFSRQTNFSSADTTPMRVQPIGGWQANQRNADRNRPSEAYESPVANNRTIYQPEDNPEQFVSQPPLSRPGEVPDATQPSGTASQMLLPQQRDPYEGMSRWQRLKMRLAAGRPLTVQNTFTTATWLFSSPNDVGMFDIYTQATFLVPSAPGFSFTPSFQVYFLDGPTRTDLPSRLYSFRGEFRQQMPLHERLAVDLAVSPGLYSDFERGGSDNVRVLGRVLFSYLWSEHSQILFGFLYLDRDDVNVLPAGGWIYTPTEDVRMELVFPRPKFAYRTSQTASYSRWIYMAGEFGGDAWAIERRNGTNDTLAYRDLRLIFGFEQKYANGRSLMLEAGYVFSREVEYTSNIGDFDPGSTGMLRAGLIY